MPEQDQLYVKIEGHEKLVQELNTINGIIKNIEEADEVLGNLRDLKKKTIKNMEENIVELNERIENIHQGMPHLEEQEMAADVSPEQEQEPEIDESVNQLHNQLETLKDELQELE
jgi:prefoldin subunit 5